MRDRSKQAEAYLREAEKTLESARVVFGNDPDEFASQTVKNAYDAMEQALSAGIAARGDDIPRRHHAKIQQYFDPFEADELEQTAFDWHSRRSDAQYVDFKGTDISIPSENFDRTDARRVLRDTEEILETVKERAEIS